jgi:hypothetical protein
VYLHGARKFSAGSCCDREKLGTGANRIRRCLCAVHLPHTWRSIAADTAPQRVGRETMTAGVARRRHPSSTRAAASGPRIGRLSANT